MHAQRKSTFRRADFRLHPGAIPNSPHWLLTHPYGWTLLATELRKSRPDLRCPLYRMEPGLHSYLEGIISRLRLREWKEPTGWIEQIRISARLLRLFWELNMSAENMAKR